MRELGLLRREIEADRAQPITTNREGRPLTDRDYAFRRMRTKELEEQLWAAAERLAGKGEHREARRRRVDALRSRHIAEFEMHIRPSLRGYSFPG